MAGSLDDFGVLGFDDLLGNEDVEADLADRDDLLNVGGILAACEAGDGEDGEQGAFHGVFVRFGVKTFAILRAFPRPREPCGSECVAVATFELLRALSARGRFHGSRTAQLGTTGDGL